MGTAMKHKILAATLTLMAALPVLASGHADFSASACASCGLEQLQTNKPLLQKINIFLVNQKDPRHEQARTGIWKAIGQLSYVPENQRGLPVAQQTRMVSNGTMVSPCVFVTEKHVAIDKESGENYNDGASHNITISVGYTPSGAPKFVKTARPWIIDQSLEMAYFRLDDKDCIGGDPDVGYIEIAKEAVATMTQVTVVGSHGDKDLSKIWRQDSCTVYGRSTNGLTLASDCSAFEGSSGAPAVTFDKRGKPTIVAVVEGTDHQADKALAKYDTAHATNLTEVKNFSNVIQGSRGVYIEESLAMDVQSHGNPTHITQTTEVIPKKSSRSI
jgi:V8-like Glu-specific endopeptidase